MGPALLLCVHIRAHSLTKRNREKESRAVWLWLVLSFSLIPPRPGKAAWGERGELVCTKPLPCQPTHFWNDENGSKYRKAYFSKFPGRWGMRADPPRFHPPAPHPRVGRGDFGG